MIKEVKKGNGFLRPKEEKTKGVWGREGLGNETNVQVGYHFLIQSTH